MLRVHFGNGIENAVEHPVHLRRILHANLRAIHPVDGNAQRRELGIVRAQAIADDGHRVERRIHVAVREVQIVWPADMCLERVGAAERALTIPKGQGKSKPAQYPLTILD